jgi:hypothetical protein
MDQQLPIAVKIVVENFTGTLTRTTKLFDSLTDEELQGEVSPGRNTGVYLLGHLVAAHDHLVSLLDLGEMKYTHFHEAFFKNPDKSGIEFPSIAQLRSDWNKVNETLTTGIATLQPEEWLHKHTAVSEEDFAKEPNRNKLNVLMTRTIHLASHYGQLLFLKKNA